MLVRAKCVNALPEEYDFQKQFLMSREGGVTREAIVTVTRDRYKSPEFEPFRNKKKRSSGDRVLMANRSNSRPTGGRDGGSVRVWGGG